MVGHRLSPSFISFVIFILSSTVFASIEECAGSAACPSSAASVNTLPVADNAEENVYGEEQEDVDDADYFVHMQMRLKVDLPPAEEEHAASLTDVPGHFSHHAASSMASLPVDHDVLAMLAGPAILHKPPAEPLPVISPASGSNLLVGILISALLIVVGLLVGILIWTLSKERQAKNQAELKAAAKAWMLDWALGFEPDKELDIKEESFSKIQLNKKKMPPTINENESSDTDEEEPEAESDYEPAFELEEAVFQAAQVEVANEAWDNEYGLTPEVRLADQIM